MGILNCEVCGYEGNELGSEKIWKLKIDTCWTQVL